MEGSATFFTSLTSTLPAESFTSNLLLLVAISPPRVIAFGLPFTISPATSTCAAERVAWGVPPSTAAHASRGFLVCEEADSGLCAVGEMEDRGAVGGGGGTCTIGEGGISCMAGGGGTSCMAGGGGTVILAGGGGTARMLEGGGGGGTKCLAAGCRGAPELVEGKGGAGTEILTWG